MKQSAIGLLFVAATLLVAVGCAKNNQSERDAAREQKRNTAEAKRKELQQVEGNYSGQLMNQSTGRKKIVSLSLSIKDNPEPVDGQVDSVPIPTLTGYLRIELGGKASAAKYVPFALQKAEFDPKQNTLTIVASNNDLKELSMGLNWADPELTGSWTAKDLGYSGTIRLKKAANIDPEEEQIGGEYGGILRWNSDKLFQYAHLTLITTVHPPEGLIVSATLRLIFGEWKSSEYMLYRFERVLYNPLSGQIDIRNDTADVRFSGYLNEGEISGEWFSNSTGKVGAMFFKRESIPPSPPADGIRVEPFSGVYQGKLLSKPGISLPERYMLSFVTVQDTSQPNGLKVTGKMRFYLGDFGSIEYDERDVPEVQYNYFTHKLVAKNLDKEKFTLKADVDFSKISGTLFADALGEVGTFEVTKQ